MSTRSEVVFLFPGQGSHEVGMGADLLRSDEWVRTRISEASAAVGEDLERLCLRGPEKKLMQAAFIQPLMTIVCLGYWRRLTEAGVHADIVAGHSLGEIAALAAAGVLTPADAVTVAVERGRLMEEAATQTPGSMAAVFMARDEVEQSLAQLGMNGRVFVANDNAPAQVVVSGAANDLAEYVRKLDSEKAGRCKPLRVSGPWHTPLLEDAGRRFEAWLERIPFSPPRTPIVTNATAACEADPAALRKHLSGQLTHPVRWRESMTVLRERAPRLLVEIGPRRVLAGLARLNGFGEATEVRGVDSLRALEQVAGEQR